MLETEQQEGTNTLREEAAEALIALSEAATTNATTTATTTRAQARAETTPQLVIPKPQRLHSIVIENYKLQTDLQHQFPLLKKLRKTRIMRKSWRNGS